MLVTCAHFLLFHTESVDMSCAAEQQPAAAAPAAATCHSGGLHDDRGAEMKVCVAGACRILFVNTSTVSSRWPPEIRLRLLPTTTMKCLIRPARSPRLSLAPSPTSQLRVRKARARTGSLSSPTVLSPDTRAATSPRTQALAPAARTVSQVCALMQRRRGWFCVTVQQEVAPRESLAPRAMS